MRLKVQKKGKNQHNRMTINYQGWRRLFLFCLGLFAGTAFCMKWMEKDLQSGGGLFTIIGLEISYSMEQVKAILSGIDTPVRNILRYHLFFDFAFMLGVYPGIAALCMMGRFKTHNRHIKQLFLVLAWAQGIAFTCDIIENILLLKWVASPGSIDHFTAYHIVVIVKWVLALTGAILAIAVVLRKRNN